GSSASSARSPSVPLPAGRAPAVADKDVEVTEAADGAAPAEQPAPAEQAAPAEQPAPAEQAAPAQQAAPAEQAAPGRRRPWGAAAALGAATVVLGGFGVWATQQASSERSGAAAQNTALTDGPATAAVRREIAAAVNTIFSYTYTNTAATRQAA